MEFNKDIKTRDELIFGSFDRNAYLGGIRKFRNMDLEKLEKLVEMRFANPDETQNFSPSIAEFIKFMKENDGYRVDGYVVTNRREDYRVSVEAIHRIESEIETKEELNRFIEFAREADEFDASGFAWWD